MHLNIWRRWKFLLTLLLLGPHTNAQQQETWCKNCQRRFEQWSDDQKLSKLCSDCGLKIVEIGQYLFTLDTEEVPYDVEHLCRECTMPRYEKNSSERMDSQQYENLPCL